jgi:hypothetical protein
MENNNVPTQTYERFAREIIENLRVEKRKKYRSFYDSVGRGRKEAKRRDKGLIRS